MDRDGFVSLLRVVTATPSRRGLAGALTGLAVGGPALGALLGVADVEAKKKRENKKKKKRCRAGTKICAGACFPEDACCPPCVTGQTCLEGGSCAFVCSNGEACPAGCDCAPGVSVNYCIPFPPPCDTFQQSCSSDADCPSGQGCILTACAGENPDRCMPFCEG